MDISVFFQPVAQWNRPGEQTLLGDSIRSFVTDFPDLEGVQVALIGVEEYRLRVSLNETTSSVTPIREAFYNLHNFDFEIQLADLGTIQAGETYQDTVFALKNVCEFLIKKNIIPIIIGGTQDLTYANYLAYEKLEQVVNLVTIDRQLDLGLPDEDLNNKNYLKSIVLHKPNFLFNLANIGSQRPYNSEDNLMLFSKLFFDNLRLGKITENISLTEPLLRNADIVSVDLNALRFSDNHSSDAGPNGLYADQMCQLCKYAGMSDKLTSFGVYEYNAMDDATGVTALLVAEMLWYFLEGVANRKRDYPIGSKDDYTKYTVSLQTDDHDIVFYKSPRSNRWWMEVPYSAGNKNKYYRNHIIPCAYEDYQIACNDEIPDRWWRTYQKLAH